MSLSSGSNADLFQNKCLGNSVEMSPDSSAVMFQGNSVSQFLNSSADPVQPSLLPVVQSQGSRKSSSVDLFQDNNVRQDHQVRCRQGMVGPSQLLSVDL